jgi:hypothetical protein
MFILCFSLLLVNNYQLVCSVSRENSIPQCFFLISFQMILLAVMIHHLSLLQNSVDFSLEKVEMNLMQAKIKSNTQLLIPKLALLTCQS